MKALAAAQQKQIEALTAAVQKVSARVSTSASSQALLAQDQ